MNSDQSVNRRLWDELAPLHAASTHYDLESFLRTGDSLGAIETGELGDVTGLRMAHLMCHIGLDSISWARRGARVVGLDFSGRSLEVARRLSAEAGTDVDFVEGDVMQADRLLDGPFDVVVLSRGVLMWIADIPAWADVCMQLLRPGGVFYLLDVHPLTLVLNGSEQAFDLELVGDYFQGTEPTVTVADGSYAVPEAVLANKESREWVHSIGKVVSALTAAGLVLDFLHEFPEAAEEQLRSEDPNVNARRLPSMYSVHGHKG